MESELEIREILEACKKEKSLLICFLFFGLALGALFYSTTKPVYITSINFEIGGYSSFEKSYFLEYDFLNSKELKFAELGNLMSDLRKSSMGNNCNQLVGIYPCLKSIISTPGLKNSLTIKILGVSERENLKFYSELVSGTLKRHLVKHENFKKFVVAKLRSIKLKIKDSGDPVGEFAVKKVAFESLLKPGSFKMTGQYGDSETERYSPKAFLVFLYTVMLSLTLAFFSIYLKKMKQG